MKFLNRLALALLLLPLTSAASNAQDVSFPDLGASVPGLAGVTYLDLARQVIPDLAPITEGAYAGHRLIDIRNFAGPDESAETPGMITLFNVAALAVASDGRERLLLRIDLGQGTENAEGFAVLALYDLGGAPKLIDAANVAFDQNTYFRDPGRLSVGEGKDVVVTMSTHFNSSQGYVTTVLILIRHDRLSLIDDIFTFDEQFCSFTRRQEPSFHAIDRGGQTYAGIEATVTETIAPTGQECDGEEKMPTPGTLTISATYQWDGTRFVADSDAFDRLAEENRTRF